VRCIPSELPDQLTRWVDATALHEKNRMNSTTTFLPVMSPTVVLAAGCSSTPSNLQTATGDTRPQPVVVQVPVEVSAPALESG